MAYVLVTTIKNEEENLPSLFKSIDNQTLKPLIWFIINDGSEDGSGILIENYVNCNSDFVVNYNFKQEVRDITWRYHYLIKFGFEKVIEIANQKQLHWDSIGVLDGDIIMDNTYFKLLDDYIVNNIETIGVVSGKLYSFSNNKDTVINEKRYLSHPTGAARLINRKLLNAIGGYPHTPSADSIILQKSRARGFVNKIIENLAVYQSRPTSSAEGISLGLKKVAYSRYYLGHTLFYCILFTIVLLFRKKNFKVFTFTFTFIKLYFSRTKRTTDYEVLNYRRNYIFNRLKEIIKNCHNEDIN